jgi:large subunit ribosomal protein L10
VALNLEDKKAIVAKVNEVAINAHAIVAAEYRGLSVSRMTELRKRGRENKVRVCVVPNNLARRAFEGTAFACMNEVLKGPLLLAFSQEEPGAAARLMRDFSKENERLIVKSLAFEGKLMTADRLNELASLPTRNEALATLMAVMKEPVTKFVRVIKEPHAKFVRTLDAVRSQQAA